MTYNRSTDLFSPEKIRSNYSSTLQERFLSERSFESFNDVETLSTILSVANCPEETTQIAECLLDSFGSLKGVLEARPEQLMTVKGMNEIQTSLVSMIIPLIRVWIRTNNEKPETIRTVKDAERYCQSLLVGERVENAYVIALNCHGEVLGKRKISYGTLTSVDPYPRLVMETALNYNAYSVILCHNHPSGTCTPSQGDILSTDMLQTHLRGVGILVVDHIIVAGNETYSMLQNRDIKFVTQSKSQKRAEQKAVPDKQEPGKHRKKNKACYRSAEKEENKMPYNKQDLGLVISMLRIEKGLTQEQLSGLAGISRSHLAALECGEKNMKVSTLWRIAEALETKPSELIQKIEMVNGTTERGGKRDESEERITTGTTKTGEGVS